MPPPVSSALVQSLASVQWAVAVRTYGSSHSTLIGLIAAWWVGLSPSEHTVFDGAPSHGSGNAGWCDLMLCERDAPVGVVEVEGTKPFEKLRTLGSYFASGKPGLDGIQFGLLAVYAYHVKGRGDARRYPPAESSEILSAAKRVSLEHPTKALILVALDKVVDKSLSSLRSSSPYHVGSFSKVTGVLLVAGNELHRSSIYESPAQGSGEV